MTDPSREVDDLLAEAAGMEEGPGRVALVQEAVRLADTYDDAELGFETRMELVKSAMSAGQPDVMLIGFSWCLAQCDRDPEKFSEEDLLWEYKWILAEAPLFPQVSRQQIEDMLADMEKRYVRAGSTLHAVHVLRRDVAQDMGDREAAMAAQSVLARTRRDWLSNCPACVADGAVDFQLFLGKPKEALKSAGPILKGQMKCAEVPQRTFALVLLPLLQEGRLEEAMAYHINGYRQIARNPKFISQVGQHLTFLTLTDNLAKGVKLLEKHLPVALTTAGLAWRFRFYLGARLLLLRLTEQGKDSLKLRLPPTLPIHNSTGKYTLAELAGWFDAQLADLAARFDARNGNPSFSQRVAELPALAQQWVPYPLPRRGAKGGA